MKLKKYFIRMAAAALFLTGYSGITDKATKATDANDMTQMENE
ncbi:hypothetical protein [Enterococcus sp. BWT-B8]|nr:hypothetical protein [Enterococcus sp. BWT-B8]